MVCSSSGRTCRGYWDYKIFVDVTFETSLSRAIKRDGYLFGEEAEIRRRDEERYFPGQKLYLEEAQPKSLADAVVGNNDFEYPSYFVK